VGKQVVSEVKAVKAIAAIAQLADRSNRSSFSVRIKLWAQATHPFDEQGGCGGFKPPLPR
jgi:hypothetical protein